MFGRVLEELCGLSLDRGIGMGEEELSAGGIEIGEGDDSTFECLKAGLSPSRAPKKNVEDAGAFRNRMSGPVLEKAF